MSFKIGKNVKKQIKDAHASVTPEQEISFEIMEILESFYFFKREFPESEEWLENLRTLRFISLLHNDIIMRLCKLVDDDSRSWSFDQTRRKLRKRSNHLFDDSELESRIKDFRSLVRPLREHRDAYIAHHAKRARTHLRPLDLLPVIRLAVEISDKLSAEKNGYRISDIDLRADVLNEIELAS